MSLENYCVYIWVLTVKSLKRKKNRPDLIISDLKAGLNLMEIQISVIKTVKRENFLLKAEEGQLKEPP